MEQDEKNSAKKGSCFVNKNKEIPKTFYSFRHEIYDGKIKLNFLKGLCPELKEIISQIGSNTDISQSKLNLSQYSDLNFSQISAFLCDDGYNNYQDMMESIIDNSDNFSLKESLKSAHSSLKHCSLYENSCTEGIIENFQSTENYKGNLSLCDFDDQQMGNGNTNIFEFYQENE